MVRPTRLDYCQYLLSMPINYTLTHFGEHSENFSHDQINRYLANARLTPRIVWEHVKSTWFKPRTDTSFLMTPRSRRHTQKRSVWRSINIQAMPGKSSTV